MSIKVVGDDTSKMKRTTCLNCTAMLEYTMADTTIKVVTDYTGDKDTYRYLTCPRCNHTMTVSIA